MRKMMREAIVLGVDGVGKSTDTQGAARLVSRANPSARITVVDSDGVFRFSGGELIEQSWSCIETLEPTTPGRARALLGVAAFTLARRAAGGVARRKGGDLLISVRDPHRIDPAAYAGVYGGPFGRLSPQARLHILGMTTRAPYAGTVVALGVDSPSARSTNALTNAPHEDPYMLQLVAEELPVVAHAYGGLYGAEIHEVCALTSTTAENIALHVEPLLSHNH